ncbi:unnamed protein product [marine sediment metagenome]|uniref:GtrA/DPMS transmembrane domain-containing protein n=1 Tax=marine sediment metagenome TaxID=412755 RepID=X1V2Z6_9ZZZZ
MGGSGVFVNLGILWLLTDFGGVNDKLSSAFAIETSIITNFILNNYFTFADRRPQGVKGFFTCLLRFNVVSLAGAGINWGIYVLLTSVSGIYYIVAQAIGIAVAMLWNYLVNNW